MQQSQQPLDTQYTGGANSVAYAAHLRSARQVAQAAGGAFIQTRTIRNIRICHADDGGPTASLLGLAGDTVHRPAPAVRRLPQAIKRCRRAPTPSATAPTNLPPPCSRTPAIRRLLYRLRLHLRPQPIRRRLRRPEPGGRSSHPRRTPLTTVSIPRCGNRRLGARAHDGDAQYRRGVRQLARGPRRTRAHGESRGRNNANSPLARF